MLTGTLSWVGVGVRLEHKKNPDKSSYKIFEIPFKLKGVSEKFLLQMSLNKKGRDARYSYKFLKVIDEKNGIIDALVVDKHVVPTNKIFLDIINHKSLKRSLVWFYGWTHLFKRYI